MTADDIGLVLDPEASDEPVLTFSIDTPFGTLNVMGEFEARGRSLAVSGMHVCGDPGVDWGWATLRSLARLIAEKLDVDEIIVVGGVRTTGANPGRAPRNWRITRAPQPEAVARNTF